MSCLRRVTHKKNPEIGDTYITTQTSTEGFAKNITQVYTTRGWRNLKEINGDVLFLMMRNEDHKDILTKLYDEALEIIISSK